MRFLLIGRVKKVLLSEYFILILAVGYFLILSPVVPGMASTMNAVNLTEIMLPLMILATGQTLVLITGGIDLSITSVVALCSVLGAMVMNGDTGLLANHPLAVPAGMGTMVVVGALIGWVNGLCVTRLKMPAFMVTLIGMIFISGLAIWLTKSQSISSLPESYKQISGNLMIAVISSGLVLIIIHVFLSQSVYGQWLYACGQNSKAARVSGIPVERTVTLAYILCGICAALGAILMTARLESASPVLGQRMLLDIIGAAIIGGTSLFGGRGKILWTLYGVVLISLVTNSLDLMGLSFAIVLIAKGGLIIVASILDAIRNPDSISTDNNG